MRRQISCEEVLAYRPRRSSIQTINDVACFKLVQLTNFRSRNSADCRCGTRSVHFDLRLRVIDAKNRLVRSANLGNICSGVR